MFITEIPSNALGRAKKGIKKGKEELLKLYFLIKVWDTCEYYIRRKDLKVQEGWLKPKGPSDLIDHGRDKAYGC